jgi:prevent-host-death family protein
MRTITVREANQHFSRYIAAVDLGEELIITKRGREVARVVPGKDAAGSMASDAGAQQSPAERWQQLWKAFESADIHGPFKRDDFYD